jgi:hypothetical protein
VFPTHGEGSFCTASGAGRSGSTIGREKAENPLYRFDDPESFADDQLGGLDCRRIARRPWCRPDRHIERWGGRRNDGHPGGGNQPGCYAKNSMIRLPAPPPMARGRRTLQYCLNSIYS